MLDKGLVFRFLEEGGWKPGIMKKERKKWVWREKSFEELQEYGIRISSVSWFTFSAILTVWRIYLRFLVNVSVMSAEVIPPSGLGTQWGRDA